MGGGLKKTFVYGRLRSLGTRDRELIVDREHQVRGKVTGG